MQRGCLAGNLSLAPTLMAGGDGKTISYKMVRRSPIIGSLACPYQKFHLNRNLKQHELTLNWAEK